MSWSISFVGKAAKVKAAVDENSSKLTGQSLAEYQEAKPHLMALIDQNITPDDGGQVISIKASGHANIGVGGTKTSSTCSVEIKQEYMNLV